MKIRMKWTSVGFLLRFDLIWFIVFNATFSYIMATSFSGGRSRCTRREPPTMGKQLVNFITCGCESSLITKKEFLRSTVVRSIWCYWSKLQWNLSWGKPWVLYKLSFKWSTNVENHWFNLYEQNTLWKESFKQRLSLIPPISTKWTIISEHKKKIDIWHWKCRSWLGTGTNMLKLDPGLGQAQIC